MDTQEDKISKLERKLDFILKRQIEFSSDINNITEEIKLLRSAESKQESVVVEEPVVLKEPVVESIVEEVHKPTNAPTPLVTEKVEGDVLDNYRQYLADQKKTSFSLEKFIGENLMNKVGIAILVIGIGIGAKYSIEHNLISPLTRIILGYLCGIGLLALGMKLKAKYVNYSAVLVSGAMATMYFVTFSAYSFYELIPQIPAFGLMLVFTVFTVIAALSYNRQVIAHIGLVGAYAVPFLLSNNSGNVLTLFTYMAIINAGILILSIKKYWKFLYYVSFGLTWLIYFVWYLSDYEAESHFALAFTFASLFYISFYITFLGYKLKQNELFKTADIVLMLTNSFVYYGIGYALLNGVENYEQLLGMFTLCNAVVHLIVGLIINKQKLADKNVYNLVVGLVLVFVTISVPVQLNGNWVTLLWAALAALLYWIGKTKKISLYEILSFPLMWLTFFSIVHDWAINYQVSYADVDERLISIFNINFLSSVIVISAFAFMYYINRIEKDPVLLNSRMSKWMTYILPSILIFTVYYAFRMEIAYYWNQLSADTRVSLKPEGQSYYAYIKDFDLTKFKTMWMYNYTFVFIAVLSIVNIKKIKSATLGYITILGSLGVIVMFLFHGIYTLGDLRDSFILQPQSEYFQSGTFNIGIRYLSISLVALVIYVGYKYLKDTLQLQLVKIYFDLILHVVVLTILSNELITWLTISYVESAYKISLSILWGVYALGIITLGIIQKKQHLRMSGISLFGATLLKLFFYDLAHLNTLEKTFVFVSLGVLLLIISFLYNKYKPIGDA